MFRKPAKFGFQMKRFSEQILQYYYSIVCIICVYFKNIFNVLRVECARDLTVSGHNDSRLEFICKLLNGRYTSAHTLYSRSKYYKPEL